MFLLQLCVTFFVVNMLAGRIVRKAMAPETLLKAIAEGRKPELPIWSGLIGSVAYWASIITGLAGVWSLQV